MHKTYNRSRTKHQNVARVAQSLTLKGLAAGRNLYKEELLSCKLTNKVATTAPKTTTIKSITEEIAYS